MSRNRKRNRKKSQQRRNGKPLFNSKAESEAMRRYQQLAGKYPPLPPAKFAEKSRAFCRGRDIEVEMLERWVVNGVLTGRWDGMPPYSPSYYNAAVESGNPPVEEYGIVTAIDQDAWTPENISAHETEIKDAYDAMTSWIEAKLDPLVLIDALLSEEPQKTPEAMYAHWEDNILSRFPWAPEISLKGCIDPIKGITLTFVAGNVAAERMSDLGNGKGHDAGNGRTVTYHRDSIGFSQYLDCEQEIFKKAIEKLNQVLPSKPEPKDFCDKWKKNQKRLFAGEKAFSGTVSTLKDTRKLTRFGAVKKIVKRDGEEDEEVLLEGVTEEARLEQERLFGDGDVGSRDYISKNKKHAALMSYIPTVTDVGSEDDGDEKVVMAGHMALRDMCAHNMQLAMKEVQKFVRGKDEPVRVNPEDLIAAANVGLVLGAREFDPERNLKFSTYAVYHIDGQLHAICNIDDGKSGIQGMSQHEEKQFLQVLAIRATFEQLTGRKPTLLELGSLSHINPSIVATRLSTPPIRTQNLYAPVGRNRDEDGGSTLADMIPSNFDVDKEIARKDMKSIAELLVNVIKGLSMEDRELLMSGGGINLSEVMDEAPKKAKSMKVLAGERENATQKALKAERVELITLIKGRLLWEYAKKYGFHLVAGKDEHGRWIYLYHDKIDGKLSVDEAKRLAKQADVQVAAAGDGNTVMMTPFEAWNEIQSVIDGASDE